ncbi:chaperonin [Apostichopus japonicus]|uniref:Chaperonin n=1 Tax=Stichopus japonicus TaxID=307972 RepID=A0A2G8JQV1_STIJA|nr:chaperonin [Apostichopus japonicus]
MNGVNQLCLCRDQGSFEVTRGQNLRVRLVGLDLVEGVVRDNKAAGVFEPGISKIKSLKFATEAAITILRIDDLIKLDPEKQEERH